VGYRAEHTGIIQDKVDSTVLQGHGVIGKLVQVVSENVLLGSSKVFTTGRLELLDIVLSHVDE
jgi:hypothetical protein